MNDSAAYVDKYYLRESHHESLLGVPKFPSRFHRLVHDSVSAHLNNLLEDIDVTSKLDLSWPSTNEDRPCEVLILTYGAPQYAENSRGVVRHRPSSSLNCK